jgi:hypothetical protein
VAAGSTATSGGSLWCLRVGLSIGLRIEPTESDAPSAMGDGLGDAPTLEEADAMHYLAEEFPYAVRHVTLFDDQQSICGCGMHVLGILGIQSRQAVKEKYPD